jgi:hypothetical protein
VRLQDNYEHERQNRQDLDTCVCELMKTAKLFPCLGRLRGLVGRAGQASWLQTQRSRARFPALPHSLSCCGPGTGYSQPLGDNWGATWMKK